MPYLIDSFKSEVAKIFFLIKTVLIKYWTERWILVRHILRISRENGY